MILVSICHGRDGLLELLDLRTRWSPRFKASGWAQLFLGHYNGPSAPSDPHIVLGVTRLSSGIQCPWIHEQEPASDVASDCFLLTTRSVVRLLPPPCHLLSRSEGVLGDGDLAMDRALELFGRLHVEKDLIRVDPHCFSSMESSADTGVRPHRRLTLVVEQSCCKPWNSAEGRLKWRTSMTAEVGVLRMTALKNRLVELVVVEDGEMVNELAQHQLEGKVVPFNPAHLVVRFCGHMPDKYSKAVEHLLELAHEGAIGVADHLQR